MPSQVPFVGVHLCHLLAHLGGQLVAHHSVAVVLAGDEGAAGLKVCHGLVGTAVAVLQLHGLGTGCQRGQLVAQTDAEGGDVQCKDLLEVLDDLHGFRRVAGTMRSTASSGKWPWWPLIQKELFPGESRASVDPFVNALDHTGKKTDWKTGASASPGPLLLHRTLAASCKRAEADPVLIQRMGIASVQRIAQGEGEARHEKANTRPVNNAVPVASPP